MLRSLAIISLLLIVVSSASPAAFASFDDRHGDDNTHNNTTLHPDEDYDIEIPNTLSNREIIVIILVCIGLSFVILGLFVMYRSMSNKKKEEKKAQHNAAATFAQNLSNADYDKQGGSHGGNNRIMVINDGYNSGYTSPPPAQTPTTPTSPTPPQFVESDVQRSQPTNRMFAKNQKNFSLSQMPTTQSPPPSDEPTFPKNFTFTDVKKNQNGQNQASRNSGGNTGRQKLTPVSEKYAYHTRDEEEDDEEDYDSGDEGHDNAGFYLNEAAKTSNRPAARTPPQVKQNGFVHHHANDEEVTTF